MRRIILAILVIAMTVPLCAMKAQDLPDAPKPQTEQHQSFIRRNPEFLPIIAGHVAGVMADDFTTLLAVNHNDCIESNSFLYGIHPTPLSLVRINAVEIGISVLYSYFILRHAQTKTEKVLAYLPQMVMGPAHAGAALHNHATCPAKF